MTGDVTQPSSKRRSRAALPVFTPTAVPAAELAERTVGRDAVIARLLAFLRTAATSRDRPHALVVGPRGSGKTHLLTVVMHYVRHEDFGRRLAIAWMPEDALAIVSYADLLVATVERLLDQTAGDQQTKQTLLDAARRDRAVGDLLALEHCVRELLEGRVLVLVLENLDRVFGGLGSTGQARLRSFMETSGELLVLASTPLLFDAVSDYSCPWYGSFHVEHLDELTPEDGSILLQRIADEAGDAELVRFLRTSEATARLHAAAHLAGGSPRMWMVLAGCMSVELLDELVPLVEELLDELVPYYQLRLWELPGVERKLIVELCRTAVLNADGRVVHQQRGMRTVTDLATACGLEQRVAASALGRLLDARWVRRSKPEGTDQRTTWYEITEPLLRHHLQYRETQGKPLSVIVGFLREWYAAAEQRRRLADAEPGSVDEQYYREALNAFRQLEGPRWLYGTASPGDLIASARCSLDEGQENTRGGLHSAVVGIIVEAVGLDAQHGRSRALQVARRRLMALQGQGREAVEATVAAGVGYPVAPAELVDRHEPQAPIGPTPRDPAGISEVRQRIASGLRRATAAGDECLSPRDRLVLRLRTARWIGADGDVRTASQMFGEAVVDCERVLGRDHTVSLRVRLQHACGVGETGEDERACELCVKLIADCQRVLGRDDPDTLGSRYGYAYLVGKTGDHERACELCVELIADRERVLGADHPDTLTTRYGHAYHVGMTGDNERARELCGKLVADCERVLGRDDPDTLSSRHLHAYHVGNTGDHEHARELFGELVPDRKRVLGPYDPDTFLSCRWHAHYVGESGDVVRAATLAAELLAECHHGLGPRAPNTKSAARLFARVAMRQEVAHALLADDERPLREAGKLALNLSARATALLDIWCNETMRIADQAVEGAVRWLIDAATAAELAPVIAHAVSSAIQRPVAVRDRWLTEWTKATAAREEFVVVHRLLQALTATLDGDPTALLWLPREEQRIAKDILDEAGSSPPGKGGDAEPSLAASDPQREAPRKGGGYTTRDIATTNRN